MWVKVNYVSYRLAQHWTSLMTRKPKSRQHDHVAFYLNRKLTNHSFCIFFLIELAFHWAGKNSPWKVMESFLMIRCCSCLFKVPLGFLSQLNSWSDVQCCPQRTLIKYQGKETLPHQFHLCNESEKMSRVTPKDTQGLQK